MGYTHYWDQRREFSDTQWMHVCTLAASAIAASGVPLDHEYKADRGPLQIDGDQIVFNGVGDDGHEPFVLRKDKTGFEFCKTNRKPYDTVVVAALILANAIAPDVLHVTSDGDEADWKAGLALAKVCLSDAYIPSTVLERG